MLFRSHISIDGASDCAIVRLLFTELLNIQKHRTHSNRIRQKIKIQNRQAKAVFLCIVWYTLSEKAGIKEPEWTEAKEDDLV